MEKLGILDSGVGGLTVLKKIIDSNIFQEIIYFADSKYFPYGIKPVNFIKQRTEEIIEFFISKEVNEIIIACNTASSIAYEYLKSKFSTPLYNIVEPAISGIERFKGERIGVLATRRTLESGIYPLLINKKYPYIDVFVESCSEGPLLEIIEEGIIEGEVIESEIYRCMKPLLEKNFQGIILGCTHLPFISPIIRKNYKDLFVIDPSEEILNILRIKRDINMGKEIKVNIYVSSDAFKFQEKVHRLLKTNYDIEEIDLERSEKIAFKGEINR
jgi:glutamate racemase